MRRKGFWNFIVIFVLSFFSACGQSPAGKQAMTANIIKNPGFEEGKDKPLDWERIAAPKTEGKAAFKWMSDPDRRSRVIGVELSQPGIGGWKQTLTLQPDSQYHISLFMKSKNVRGNGLGTCCLFPRFRYWKPLSIKGTQEWKEYSSDILNSGYTNLDIVCTLGGYGVNTGLALFDDVSLRKVGDPAQDPDQTAELDWGLFQLRYNLKRGYITSLKPGKKYPDAPEFLGSYPTLPYLESEKDVFLGDVALDVIINNAPHHLTTADASCTHSVAVKDGNLRVIHRTGPGNPEIKVVFSPGRDMTSMDWSITLENPTSNRMEIGSVEIPLPWNDNYSLFNPHDKASQKLLYTRRVAEHKYIGGMSSYVLACPMDGSAPMLLLHPDNSMTKSGDVQTSFEFTYHSPDSIRNQIRDTGHWIHGAWPGLTRVCLKSKSLLDRKSWEPRFVASENLVLKPGESASFHIKFNWLSDRADTAAVMADNGLLGFRIIPGPAVPIHSAATVIVYGAKKPVQVKGVSKWSEIPAGDPDFKGVVISLELEREGEQPIDITDARGVSGRLFMAGLASIDDLMQRRARFILDHQAYFNKSHPLNHAILCYNNQAGSVLVRPNEMWGSGGYEGGITDAMFLAMKNLDYPDREQIRFMEDYIDQWLLGGIQNPNDFGVAWTVARKSRTERGYNYIHVLNLYDAMARAAASWPGLFREKPEHYLDLWFKTFEAFQRTNVKYRDLGLMGRGNITFMPELFRRYDLDEQAEKIEAEIRRWAEYWCAEPPYPYGSELFFDNTGYESVFFYRDYIGKRDLAQQVVDVTKAGRGRAPVWFWNDSDQRWWDAVRTRPKYDSFTDFGENCHHYMTGLNGYMLLEAYDRGYNPKEPGPIGYSGILNSWVRVTASGFAGMCYCPDPASDNYGLNQFTGDVGLGLWGNLKAARCYVVDDPVIGRVCYGGALIPSDAHSISVRPFPGFTHRIRFHSSLLSVDSEGPEIQSMQWDTVKHILTLHLSNPFDFSARGFISITGLPVGTYQFQSVSISAGKPSAGKKLTVGLKEKIHLTEKFQAKTSRKWILKFLN